MGVWLFTYPAPLGDPMLGITVLVATPFSCKDPCGGAGVRLPQPWEDHCCLC